MPSIPLNREKILLEKRIETNHSIGLVDSTLCYQPKIPQSNSRHLHEGAMKFVQEQALGKYNETK
jgi:hypothetical protein